MNGEMPNKKRGAGARGIVFQASEDGGLSVGGEVPLTLPSPQGERGFPPGRHRRKEQREKKESAGRPALCVFLLSLAGQAACFFNISTKCLRNLCTLGATIAMQ